MAIDKIKTSPEVAPKKSRLEMNVRQLLNKCELIAKQEAVEGNWRLKKYVDSLSDMITELKTGPDKPSKDLLSEYSKRASFLKGLIQTSTFNSPTEKLEAVQLLSHGAATLCTDASAQEIHQKTVAKYGNELRSELFGLEDNDDPLRKRNIIKAPNFTSTSSSQEDMDSLLKYHQNMQEKVAENMVLLTKSLKEQSQIASTIIKGDTEALKKSSDLTDRNLDALKVESERLQEHSRSAWKCWLWIMLGLVMVIFINMVLLMKVMKKRKIEL
ncbi:vesicle transport protein Use1 [Choristoneura fumiferana]|uniref:vesicle transport protein Use1 n=1 Tax=Choristoneura fumiferana TaxID=7141 RepID=UPI003D159420